jgi:hypothetical protein
MDSIKTFSISTEYRDHRTPISWETRLFAEVVFVDKTHESSAPLLYQLKESISLQELERWKDNNASFPKESFMLLGEIASIDKKKKQILLFNQNVVAYRYLVIASGSTPVVTVYGDEFTAGLHALIDALRMKSKIPSSFANPLLFTEREVTVPAQDIKAEIQDAQIDKVVHPSIRSAAASGNSVELNASNKRLYEVQL